MSVCEWCKRDGCRDHESAKVFPLGDPAAVPIGRDGAASQYVKERDALIPVAARIASDTAGSAPTDPLARRDWGARWSRAFHAAMERLWQARREESRPI